MTEEESVCIEGELGQIEDCAARIRAILSIPSDEEFEKATKESASFMVQFHAVNRRWPEWWEAFEAGRRLGEEQARGSD